MKKITLLFAIVVFSLLLVSVTANAGPVPEGVTLDYDTAYFTCDSNPADFNGKHYQTLYVNLKGCKNFDSSIIPGEDAFVTLDNIFVYDKLYFTDGTVDPATGKYTEAAFNENETRADHYLNITGDSYICDLYMTCTNPHTCNFGVQFPARVYKSFVFPTNGISRGKIVYRGYIDPLVDSKTDYYHDTVVKSFPDFNLNTFDLDFVRAASEDPGHFYLSLTDTAIIGYPSLTRNNPKMS